MAKKKSLKNGILLFILFVFVVGAIVGGYFTAGHITRNDVFEVIGNKEVTIRLGETYQDEGAKAISFGKDISDKIVSEENIDYSTAGEYYIKYTVDDIRYNGIERYRIIIIVDLNNETEEVIPWKCWKAFLVFSCR